MLERNKLISDNIPSLFPDWLTQKEFKTETEIAKIIEDIQIEEIKLLNILKENLAQSEEKTID